MKALVLVGTFNQEKAVVGAFSVIVKTDGSFAALRRMLTEAVLSVSRVQARTSTAS